MVNLIKANIMAIGDTVQAGLLRADFSPIQKAGQAQAQANQAFGQTLGGLVDKFYQKKKEKAEKEQLKQAYLKLGMSEEVADAAKNDKDLAGQFINKMNADRNYDLQMDQFNQLKSVQNLQKKRIKQGIANTKADRLRDQEARLKEQTKAEDLDRFIGTREMVNMPIGVQDQNPLMRGVKQPTAQVPQGDYMGNRFMQTEQGRSDFTSMVDAGIDPSDALDMASKFEAQELANQPKAQKIVRTITVQDGEGGFTQVGVDEAGNPVKDFGPPKPSGMYPTPKEQAKGKEDILSVENANEFVNQTRTNSLESAKSIRPATRALTLLEKGDLDTGGIAELKTNTIAMLDSLGIPIDKETMDKVANTQNFRAEVGKFLFENISNTKGSISEKEMDIFAKISPGLQMTPEANKVLLQYVIKKAERDKDRVKFIQDMRRKGVGIVEQRNRLEDYMIENDLSEVLSPIAGQPSEQTPQNTFNLNGQNVQGEVVGTKPNGDKLIKVNGQIFVQPAQ